MLNLHEHAGILSYEPRATSRQLESLLVDAVAANTDTIHIRCTSAYCQQFLQDVAEDAEAHEDQRSAIVSRPESEKTLAELTLVDLNIVGPGHRDYDPFLSVFVAKEYFGKASLLADGDMFDATIHPACDLVRGDGYPNSDVIQDLLYDWNSVQRDAILPRALSAEKNRTIVAGVIREEIQLWPFEEHGRAAEGLYPPARLSRLPLPSAVVDPLLAARGGLALSGITRDNAYRVWMPTRICVPPSRRNAKDGGHIIIRPCFVPLHDEHLYLQSYNFSAYCAPGIETHWCCLGMADRDCVLNVLQSLINKALDKELLALDGGKGRNSLLSPSMHKCFSFTPSQFKALVSRSGISGAFTSTSPTKIAVQRYASWDSLLS